MKRVRLAPWAATASAALVALLSGCMSTDPCGGRPGLFGRFGCCRPRCSTMNYQGPPPLATPVSSGGPFTGLSSGPGCCEGGPELPPSAIPGESLYNGPMLSPEAFPGPEGWPGKIMGAPIYLPPNAPLPQGAVPAPNGSFGGPPRTTLPTPEPADTPRLTPVPNGGFAQPTPANPSPTSRRKM